MVVCFYFDNELISGVDCRRIDKGNPGIGGTEYLFLTIPLYLNKLYCSQFDIYWLARDIRNLPDDCKKVKIESLIDAKHQAERIGCDIFIWRPLNEDSVEMLADSNFKLIAWEHNLPGIEKLDRLIKLRNLGRYICVSREHLDQIRGHKIYYKTNFIYNAIDTKLYSKRCEKDSRLIIFLGALNPRKGFHIVANNWKKILNEVPDAKLEVIGSGNLYDRQVPLGKFSIADEEYEEKILKQLCIEGTSEMIPSVKFHGTLGIEKNEKIASAIIGIVNPSDQIETFGISAVEIQASGTAVLSAAEGGLLETVKHKHTGLLAKSEKQFVDNIIYLLKNPEIAFEMGENGSVYSNKFDFDTIIPEWSKMLLDVYNNIPNKPLRIKSNIFYRKKFLAETDRILIKYLNISLLKIYLKIKHAKTR